MSECPAQNVCWMSLDVLDVQDVSVDVQDVSVDVSVELHVCCQQSCGRGHLPLKLQHLVPVSHELTLINVNYVS